VAADADFDEGLEASALDWIAANSVQSDAPPTDLVDEHGHYLYGCPKKESGAWN